MTFYVYDRYDGRVYYRLKLPSDPMTVSVRLRAYYDGTPMPGLETLVELQDKYKLKRLASPTKEEMSRAVCHSDMQKELSAAQGTICLELPISNIPPEFQEGGGGGGPAAAPTTADNSR